ncbi:MAG: hypothetical protein Q8R29_01025 [bacterium]|nr:hypothetical protein [bacterium]
MCKNWNTPNKKTIYKCGRFLLVVLVIFGGSFFIVEKLTPPEYTIRFKRECDGVKCEKVKVIDSERNASIENEVEVISSALERLDFFARFTFLSFDFQTTNQSQLIFAVTEPKYEKGVDIMMQCNLNGKEYIFSPNSGIIFQQKSSIGNLIQKLGEVQNVLINCNPAPQDVKLIPTEQIVVAPNAQVQFIYNEEKYHLKFLPDRWNYLLTVLQVFIILGIVFSGFYAIKQFIKGSDV